MKNKLFKVLPITMSMAMLLSASPVSAALPDTPGFDTNSTIVYVTQEAQTLDFTVTDAVTLNFGTGTTASATVNIINNNDQLSINYTPSLDYGIPGEMYRDTITSLTLDVPSNSVAPKDNENFTVSGVARKTATAIEPLQAATINYSVSFQ